MPLIDDAPPVPLGAQAPFLPGRSYDTPLDLASELQFRQWLKDNKVPFNPDANGPTDYDMRGYWQGLMRGNPQARGTEINPNDNRPHYPDYYKTPLHDSFSAESQWAGPNTPDWANDHQLADPSGRVVFDEKPVPHGLNLPDPRLHEDQENLDMPNNNGDDYYGYASGGGIGQSPWWARNAARSMQIHSGPINSPVAGRTDHIPLNVASGSYVVPADIVSGLGQGNTAAGHQVIKTMFHSGPYGDAMKAIHASAPIKPKLNLGGSRMKFADGGAVPIMAAGGEHVLTPEQVVAIGNGDIDAGHNVLDEWVKAERKRINKEQKQLPGPAKD